MAWDLNGTVPGLAVAAGLYTPSSYPFRDMSNGYKFQTSETASEMESASRFKPKLVNSSRLRPWCSHSSPNAASTSIGVGTMKEPTNTMDVTIEGIGTLHNVYEN